MKCSSCGFENEENAKFCKQCGAPLGAQQTQPPQYAQQAPAYDPNNVPEEYKPISMWGYFGYELLFNIPLVGFILLLVFSFGGTKNHNLKNFARSYFCMLILVLIIAIILVAAVGTTAGLSALQDWKH
jgi:uncharacterized membrane protein YvbJ